FKIFREKNFTKKIIKGDGSPLQMDSEGVLINEYVFSSGIHSLKIKKGFIHSIFILEGNLENNKILSVRSVDGIPVPNIFMPPLYPLFLYSIKI
mgnify:CR=1